MRFSLVTEVQTCARPIDLIGGSKYEPHEENPMIGFRGASRYVDPSFKDCFALECHAVKRVREDMGLDNVWVMIPFVRTLGEGRRVLEVLRENGLEQGKDRSEEHPSELQSLIRISY